MKVPADDTVTVGDRYVLDGVIGRGGMAEVHRGRDIVLDRPVAVKILREVTDDPADRARFVAEAKTLARLNHAGLVTVLDAGTTASDRPFLVMELIDGPDLAECCTGTALDITQVAAVGTQVADGLAHAHRAGVVHRDVKPSNIMLGEDGRVWLTDFGIARLIGDTAHHTRTGTTIGSPAYLAPEQVRGAEITPACDVYSLGLVLLEMLTGRRSYPQSSTEAALARLTNPPELPAGLPGGWESLLRRMTALEPHQRPGAEEVATELRRLSESEDTTTVTAAMVGAVGRGTDTRPLTQVSQQSAPTGAVTRSAGSASRWTWLAVTVALGVVVLVVALFVLPGGSGTAEEVPDGVPPELREPLGELHEAVNGGGS